MSTATETQHFPWCTEHQTFDVGDPEPVTCCATTACVVDTWETVQVELSGSTETGRGIWVEQADSLTPAGARKLAAELIRLADLVEST